LHVVRLDTDQVKVTCAEFVAHLKNRYRVGTAKHYPAVWSWEAFQSLGYTGEGCPVAAKACDQVFSTPVFPRTTDEELQYVAWAIRQSLADLKH
jgi:dTDP-4-amino-4,6-dideoxygalactose transaminase